MKTFNISRLLLLLLPLMARCQSCSQTLSEKQGIISSPNYPSDYPPNRDCYWDFLSGSDGSCVKFSVEDLVIPSDEESLCPGDHFVFESCGAWWTIAPERYLCGDYTERIKNSKRNSIDFVQFFQPNATSLRVSFHSDSSGAGRGFLMQYSILDRKQCAGLGSPAASDVKLPDGESVRCFSGPHNKEIGTIESIGYPRGYLSDTACIYIIEKPSSEYCGVQLFISKFDLEEADFGVCHDFLAIPGCRRQCGTLKRPSIQFYDYQPGSKTIFLQFVADFSTEGRGFRMTYIHTKDCFKPEQPGCPNDQLSLLLKPSECSGENLGDHDCASDSQCHGAELCCWNGCKRKCVKAVQGGTERVRNKRSVLQKMKTESGIFLTRDSPQEWEKAKEQAVCKKGGC